MIPMNNTPHITTTATFDTTEAFTTEFDLAVESVTTVTPWGFKWEARRDFYFPETLPEWDDNDNPANPAVHAEWVTAAKVAVSDWRNCTGEFLDGQHI